MDRKRRLARNSHYQKDNRPRPATEQWGLLWLWRGTSFDVNEHGRFPSSAVGLDSISAPFLFSSRIRRRNAGAHRALAGSLSLFWNSIFFVCLVVEWSLCGILYFQDSVIRSGGVRLLPVSLTITSLHPPPAAFAFAFVQSQAKQQNAKHWTEHGQANNVLRI